MTQPSSMSTSTATPSFLLKLQEIMQGGAYSHIIRWDKTGHNLCIACVQSLEQEVLPRYFRHSKFASFVRQLNMYGFHKKKAEKNMTISFHNQHFSRTKMNFSAIGKKGKRIPKDLQNKNDLSNTLKQANSEHTYLQCSAQLEMDSQKQSAQSRPIKNDTITNESGLKKTQIYELIEELTQRAEPLLEQIGNLGYLDLQKLLKQPKYQRANYAIFGIMDTETMNPFANLPVYFKNSDQMEFIL